VVLIVLSAAWVAGLYLGSLYEISPLLITLGALPLPLLFIKKIRRKIIIVAALSIILFTSASVYSYAAQNRYGDNDIRFFNDTGKLELEGTVIADPEVRDKSVRLTVEINGVNRADGRHEVRGKALVFAPRYPSYAYGDILHMRGEPVTPPQLGDFDYQGYLEHQGIYTTIAFPQIETVESDRGSSIMAGIYDLRQRLARSLAEILPEPQAALAQGILLGLRGNIPPDLDTAFSNSGSSHLLAISGYNITVMAGILLAVGIRLLGRRYYLYVWLAMAAVWIYTIITGFNPPVVRGAVMATVFLLAEALGRQRSAASALALAAAVMAGFSPYILGDASFQLSFAAMAGLIFIHPVISGWCYKVIEKTLGEDGWHVTLAGLIVEMFSVSIAALLAVWPLIAYYFGLFSWAGPLSTFLLTFIQPFIIVIGLGAAILGLAADAVGRVLGLLLWPFLAYMIAVVQWLGGSTATTEITWVNPAFIWVYYAVLAVLLWLYQRLQKARSLTAGTAGLMQSGVSFGFGMKGGWKWIAIPLLLLAVFVTFTAATIPDDKLRVSFLDVGEGDAVLVQKGSTQVLIDGGPSPQAVTLALSEQMPFWDRTIETVVITHFHQDHLAGIVEVLKRYRVEMVILPLDLASSPLLQELETVLVEKDIPSIIGERGQRIKLGDVTLDILDPPPVRYEGTESDPDNNSIAIAVRDGDISFLLTGDMMQTAERQLIWEREVTRCTVLKAAHHGSDTSSGMDFLNVVTPQAVVISCGAENKYGHPDAGTVGRLGEKAGPDNVYRTDLDGTITFMTDGERLWVKKERE
jgi:competence protein ComEC